MQTKRGEADREILEDVQPVLSGLDCRAVEIKSAVRRGVLHVVLIIHREGGVDLQICTHVYKAVYPRLEILYPGKEIHLEVSSPGISRVLKSPEEFEVFKGQGVELLLDEETEWRRGTIVDTSENSVDIISTHGVETYQYATIRKAKLDNL